jgi:sugar phosphate isomerase/epimerase
MGRFKVGVIVDSFKLPVREGVKKAAEVGADGIQVYIVKGEMAPENMDSASRRDFVSFVRDNGLEISALCGDLGGHGFEIPDDNVWKIEKSKRMVDLAVDLGCGIITSHLGVLPLDINEPRRAIMQEASFTLAKFAAKAGVTFALETGAEPASVLRKFLDEIGSKGMAVNFDPANLAMVIGEDPAETVKELGSFIVHTHAKDGVMLKKIEPKLFYDTLAEGDITEIERVSEYILETPLGEGSVDFPRYLDNLEKTGFSGYLTIEREAGDKPAVDIKMAVDFLRELV